MAKKNLHNLMSGIIGDSGSTATDADIKVRNEEMNPLESQVPKRRPGRPKKENDYTRTTIVISAELLRKLKYVSLMEDTTFTDLVNDAFSLYVSKWENDNGPIRLPKK